MEQQRESSLHRRGKRKPAVGTAWLGALAARRGGATGQPRAPSTSRKEARQNRSLPGGTAGGGGGERESGAGATVQQTAATTTTTHIGHDLLPMASNTASCLRLRTCGRGGASVHGCRQYQSIARQGRWGSSFLSGHKTTASYWPLPALHNVSKRLSPSAACTEAGSFLGEVPYLD